MMLARRVCRSLSTAATLPGVLVQPGWVREVVEARQPGVVFLDSSWHMPAAKRNPAAEFEAVRIPGARFFDVDACANHAVPYPHMMVRWKEDRRLLIPTGGPRACTRVGRMRLAGVGGGG
jgi:3-mercaptopyruvate sulfurtransferase SseA